MKINLPKPNHVICFAILLLLFTISCNSKSDMFDQNNKNNLIESPIASELLSQKNINVVSLSFGTQLSEIERYSFVYKRIEIIESLSNLSESQKKIINELRNLLSSELYIPNSKEQDYFTKNILPQYINRVEKLFTRAEIKSIFYSFDSPQITSQIIQFNSNKSETLPCGPNQYYTECLPRTNPCKAGCDCMPGYVRVNNGDCVRPEDVSGCNCASSDSYCDPGYVCSLSGCDVPLIGCGFLLMETCDGLCS